ncbi:MAG: cyclic pyranopterin monophosphate synthase MoaC, partial [Defluviitaleaceae bacterium]|nr:cyclic pyranopterin monophosphate synthase MoaC [Defluviitaleaceae bacterium]
MQLNHFDTVGNAIMVDISSKSATVRTGIARGCISMKPETLALISAGKIGKGDVLGVARVAGIMAAKRTSELIPMCHNILIES